MNMDINFKKMLSEDPEFDKYAKEIIYKIMIDVNPSMLAMIYPMYAKDLPKDVAYDTIKMMIMLGGDSGTRRNS